VTEQKKSIAEIAKELGVELLPWQARVAEQLEQGNTLVIHHGGQKAGRRTMRRILNLWDAQEDQTTNQEIRRQP
jgi:hypothetical protein